MSTTNQDALVAFLITALAGAATALGASVVFFPSLVKLASRRVLAGALGFSAGVMTYVSFVEIFQKSVGAFEEAEFEENMAYIYATVSFFGGVVVMKVRCLFHSGCVFINFISDRLTNAAHPEPCSWLTCVSNY